MPKFSVIIPTRNEEEYVGKALKSVIRQTVSRKEMEIIVCDAESSDKTVKTARKYADKIIVKKTRNPAQGRNLGAKIAKGEILMFLDADSELGRNSLRKINEVIKKGYVAGTFLIKYKSSRLIDSIVGGTLNFLEIFFDFFGMKFGNGNCIFIKKKIFKKIKGFNTKRDIGEDHELMRHAAKYGKTILIKSIKVKTSVRRPRKEGWIKILNLWIKGLFFPNFKQSNYWLEARIK